MFAKGKAGFVNGKLPKPNEAHDNFMPRQKDDSMVKVWICYSLIKEIQENEIWCESWAKQCS